MNLHQILLILRARYRLILLMLLMTVGAALAVSLYLPKQYIATSAVVVDVKSPDPVIGVYLPAISMPGYMATQVDILNSVRVAQKVVKLTQQDKDAKAMADWQAATGGKGSFEVWLVARMQRGLDVRPSRESNVININYKAGDPVAAAAIANAYAKAYIDTTVDMKVEPAREFARYFESQGKVLRDNVENAQNRLSEYQQRKGIVASDERLDSETAKLNELSSQLTVVQGQTADAESKMSVGGALPEVAQNSMLMSLRADVARLEARLQDASGNFGVNHPQYQRMQAELTELKARLAAETRYVSSGISASRNVGRGREAQLRAAMELQKKKVLELKLLRGELGVLQRDVESAQKAFEAVSQRYNQASLESQATQSNVSMLTQASEPLSAASPKTLVNLIAALVMGTLLGIGAVFLLEFLDRPVRSLDDLSELLQLPALGVVPATSDAKRSRLPWHGKAALQLR